MLFSMDRLELELYADRLARHADRLADELAAARLRRSWAALEDAARTRLAPGDTLLLESVGVLAGRSGTDDEGVIARRAGQLAALGRLQAFVEEELARRRSG